jgi:hypothetical protein
MSITSQPTSVAKRKRIEIPPLPRIDASEPAMTERELVRWIKSIGAKPISAATKKRLIASGNWGMPNE